MKRKPIKIKHRKYNLYNHKKSKGKQVLTVILTIVILAALAVVGFGLGRPLMEYLNGERKPTDSTVTAEAPTQEAQTTTTTTAVSTEPVVETEEPPEPEVVTETVYSIPSAALKSAESLRNAVAAAKNSGYTSVMVTVKGDDGIYLYDTVNKSISSIYKLENAMTAKEICDIIKDAGLKPCARFSTLKDPISVYCVEGVRYWLADGSTWLDAAYNNGGKAWLSPFNENTAKYIATITSELAAAGFTTVVLADLKYPPFGQRDYTEFLSHITEIQDADKRVQALWEIVDASNAAAKSRGAEILVELSSEELDAADRSATAAELAADTAKLKAVKLLIDWSGSDTNAANSFCAKMASLYSGQQYTVGVTDTGLSADAKQKLIDTFADAGISVILNN